MSSDERLPEIRAVDGGANAQQIVAATIDTMALHQIPLTSRAKGMIARQAKELLADGFPPDVLLTAAVTAIRRGAPMNMHYIAQDIVVAQAQQRLTRKQYEGQLDAAHRLLDPSEIEHRERLQRILGGGESS